MGENNNRGKSFRHVGKNRAKARVRDGHENLCRGFTFIELLVAVAIVATLAAIAVPVFTHQIHKARNNRAIAEIISLEAQISLYRDTNNALPGSLNDIGAGGMLDPWGNPYVYLQVAGTPQGHLRKDRFLVPVNTDYDLYSKGRDGLTQSPFSVPVSHDDIVRASDGAFIGPAAEF